MGLDFRNVVSQTPRDVLHGDRQRALAQGYSWHLLDIAVAFDEHAVGAIDHDLADRLVENEVFDGLQKRKDHFESVLHKAPSSSCSKYDLFGSL